MKVYFSCSSKFFTEHKNLYDKLLESLERFTDTKPYVALGDIDYQKSTEEDIVKAVKNMEKELRNSDVVVTENTYSIAGVGFDIATALNMKKPVLVLNLDSKPKAGPHPINTLDYKLLTYERYNEENLEKVLRKFVQEAKQKIDTKFILIISPQIDRYLEWAAEFKRMHKAQIVRNAVEEMMEKDPEFKKASKEEV